MDSNNSAVSRVLSMRPFIGSEDYSVSRSFYRDLGFEEIVISLNMSYFNMQGFGFYLQDAYVKDWVDNTMLFLEVEDVEAFFAAVKALQLPEKYAGVRVHPIKTEAWGKEFFVHDPAGILWHVGNFK